MRISTGTVFNTNVTQLDTLSASLAQTQQQVSSGRRILTPADDPAAAALVLQVSQTAATNTQYQANIGAAQNAITLGEGALQSVTTLVQSVQTTAVQAGNPALANSDRATLASTLQSDLTQLISLANSTDSVGNFLFSGFKGATQPFVQVQTPTGPQVLYNGDDGQRSVQVSSSEQVATSDSGASIFMRVKNGNGNFTTGASSTVQVSGTTIMPGPIAAAVPVSYSTVPATFTVDGNVPAVTVNQDVTVAGNGTGPGTLAASIQAGLVAAGLTSYSVASAANGGLEITHTGSTNAVVLSAITDPSGNIVAGQSMAGVAAGNSPGANVLAGATVPAASVPILFSGAPATFTVDGTPVTVNQDVTVAGTGTGAGTLAAAIQAGLTAAGLTTYSVSPATGGGLQITNNGSSTAVAIAGAIDPSGNIVNGPGTAGIAKLPNTGSGVISIGSLSNPPPTTTQMGNSYQITFNGSGTYNISGTDSTGAPLPVGTNTLPTPSTNLPYTSGQTISFNGVQFSITGTPTNGDTFVVKPSTNESVFTTIQNLITTLNTPVVPGNAASSAQMTAGVNTAINNLSNDLNSVLSAQSSQGTRLNVLTNLNTTGAQEGLTYTQTISTLQDLDYNVGLSNLSEQQTILKAAQQSFVQVEGLSIFNYLR
jgi:flagellar hook-associated protein 3 FlgL